MTDSLVSVIMPVFNKEQYVSEAIDSVLGQSHGDLELLVIDDASSDDSLERILGFRDPRLKCIQRKENGGAGIARNEGIRKARGRYIAFIDADDVWLEEKLARQLRFMQDEKAVFSYTDYYLMDEQGRLTSRVFSPSRVDLGTMKKNNYIGCLTAMYDARALGKAFMPDRRKRQDWALWLDLLRRTDHALGLQTPLAAYRITKSSLSRDKLSLVRENYLFFKEVLGCNDLVSALYFTRFLFAYSLHKITSIKSID